MALQDKTLVCRDCGEEFVFTAGEQGFYLEKGLLNDPQRCPACRASRRRERADSQRQMTTVVTTSQTLANLSLDELGERLASLLGDPAVCSEVRLPGPIQPGEGTTARKGSPSDETPPRRARKRTA